MSTRVNISDSDRELALKEGLVSARGDEFILSNGDQPPINPLTVVGANDFDVVLAPSGMIRPFDSADHCGHPGMGPNFQGRDPGQDVPSPSQHYSLASGKRLG